jgi:predicted aspartyl protease
MRCAQMLLMRAAVRVLALQCVLLASTALAAGVAPESPGSLRPPSKGAPGASPALSVTAPTAADAGLPSPPGAPAGPAAQPLPAQDLLFACPTTLDHLGRVVAQVMVDGKGPFRFVVDTGANHSTVSPQLAAYLGLTPSLARPIRVTGVTGSGQFASVPIEMLKAGDLEIANSRFPVIWSRMMAGAAGILGAAGLRQDRLVVDFVRDRVLITRSRTESFPRGFTTVWAMRLHGGLLSVPGRVGDVPVRAIVDTGSQYTLGNAVLYRELFERERGKGRYVATDVYGATHQVGAGKLQVVPPIDLGAIKIGGVALVFGDFHIFQAWHLTGRPTIILGMDVLGTVKAFAVDFRYGEIGFKTRYSRAWRVRSAAGCQFGGGLSDCGD